MKDDPVFVLRQTLDAEYTMSVGDESGVFAWLHREDAQACADGWDEGWDVVEMVPKKNLDEALERVSLLERALRVAGEEQQDSNWSAEDWVNEWVAKCTT